MKLHLPTSLRAALMATFAAILTLGSAAYASTTYTDLTTPDYFEANGNVYNTGKGTFYLETPSCDLNLTLTLNLKSLADYQSVHDYANSGYYSPFVTWTYNNNPGATYGLTDVSSGYNGADYSGYTGYWAGKPWSTGTKITTDTLWSDYADADGNVTLTINNTPNGTTRNVIVTAVNKSSGSTQELYVANGLRSQNYTSQHITSFTVNMNYVTSVTLNTASTLDSSNFTPPKDYSVPFQSQRTDDTSVGRIMFLGDSITHGVQDMSYRWGLFKIFVDNGIENEIAGPLSGYHSQPLNGDYNGDFSTSQYGGETFVNAHYAQSSGRTHNMLTASGSVNALGNSTGVNYGGVSSTKTGKDYNADTYVMMMGTNDILSDGAYNNTNMPKVTERLLGAGSVQNGVWVNADQEAALIGALGTDPATTTYTGKWGTMGQIIDNMKMDASDTMYIVSIPTWGEGRTGLNGAAPYVAEYNVKLEKWVDAYNASHTGTVKYVDVNKGLVNVTRNGQFLAPDAFFRTAGGDYIHPNEQGALIIAGNLAQGMGIGGRTAGLTRSAVGHADHNWQSATATINLSAGQSVQAISDAFTIDGGYTIDFGATFGDGSANGWLANTNALSVFIGDGTNSGTLKISEGYISWGDKLLYCQDNHLTTNDNLRVAYTQGNASQNIGSGYYVWLGDKLIGQALTAGTGNAMNGVTLTSTGGSSVITGLSYTNTAYAPSTNFITAYDNGLVSSDGPTPPSDVPLTPMPSHDNANKVVSGVDWDGAVNLSAQKGVTAASSFVNGIAKVSLTRTDGWFSAGAVTATGDIIAKVADHTTGNNGFAMQDGTLTGSVTMDISSATLGNGEYKDAAGVMQGAALAGTYGNGKLTGTFSAFIDNSTLNGDMVGGALNGSGSVGAVNFVVNSGTVSGTIYGGSKTAGTVGDGTADAEGNFSNKAVAITVNGGHITGDINGGGTAGVVKGNAEILITGGVIDGHINGGDIQGASKVTIQGNQASIGGNISADTVVLKDVSNSGHSDGFDQYGKKNIGEEGKTITATNLELNNYKADEVKAQLVGEHLHVTGKSATNVSHLNLTACDITVDAGSALTLSGTQEYGHTTSYTGNITIAKETTFSVANPSNGERPHDESGVEYTSGTNGFRYEGYVYDVLKPTSAGAGSLLDEDGQALGLTTNLTLQGAGKLKDAFFVYKADTGILSAYERILTDTCYINTGVLVYSKEAGAYGATESLQLNNGANLVMADNLVDGVNIQSNGGTLTLLDKVKLDASRLTVNSNTVLAGAGTFALSDNSKALAVGLSTDAEEWKGTILMSTTAGQTITDISAADLNALAPNADAWVEMSNVTASLADSDENISSNIRLVGEDALVIVAGSGHTYTFSGSIAGDGALKHTAAGNAYVMSGDISGWHGSFSAADNESADMGLTLQGKATTVNSALKSSATGSALNLSLGDITNGAGAYTFNNEVVVKNLSAAGKNIVLGAADDALPGGSLEVRGTASVGQLSLQEHTSAVFGSDASIGTLSVVDGATVTINGGTTTLSTGLTQNSAADSARSTDAAKCGSIVVNRGAVLDVTSLADNYFGEDKAYGQTNAFRFANLVNNTTGEGTVKMKGMTIQFGGNETYSGDSLTFRSNYEFNNSLNLADYSKDGRNGNKFFHWIVGSQDAAGSISVHNDAGTATLTMKNGQTLDIRANGAVTADKLELGQIGHNGYLTMSGGSLTTGTVSSFDASTFSVTGGTLEFTDADAFATNNSLTVSIIGSSADAPVTLRADSSSWTLNHTASVGNVVIDTAADKTITLGSTGTTTTFSGTVKNGGNLVLAGSISGSSLSTLRIEKGGTLVFDFDDNANETFAGSMVLNGTIKNLDSTKQSYLDLFNGSASLTVEAGQTGTLSENVALRLRRDNAPIFIGAGSELVLKGGIVRGDRGNGTMNVTGSGQMLVQGGQLTGGDPLSINNNMTGAANAIVFDGVTIGKRVNLGGSGNIVFRNGADLTADMTSGFSLVANTDISLEGGADGAKATYDLAKTDLAIYTNKTVALQSGADLTVKGIFYSGTAGSQYGNLTIDSTSSLTATGVLRMQSITNEGSVVLDKVDGEEKTVGKYSQSSKGSLELKAGVEMQTEMKSGGSIDGCYDLGTGAVLNVKNIGSSVSANVNDLTLAANAVMGVYKANSVPANPSTDAEATMIVSGTLKAGDNASLNANLVLGTNAKLDFTGENGLHMGSSLTLQSSSEIDLGDTLMLAINGMVCGDRVVLFTGVDALSLGGASYDSTKSYSAGDYFNLTGVTYADHMVVDYNDTVDGGRVSIFMATPEPATATLSLLALTALAARRRRK